MQDDLVMNKLPLPQYYDGEQWNTQLKPTRKCIPKYLHEDLPALKHMYIKQKFKEIGKFNCPKLDYFDKLIKNKKHTSKPLQKKYSQKKNNKQIKYSQLKQQLQYALIIADKNSNVIDNLLLKAKQCNQDSTNSTNSTNRRQKNKRLSAAKDTGKYFSNTVELIFRQRKRQLQEHSKIKQELDLTSAQEKLRNIKLLPFQN